MTRDYVARRASPAKKKKAQTVPGWVWLFAGLCIGLAIAVMAYISRPATPMPRAEPVAKAETEEPEPKKKVEIPPKEKSRFTFYELLPSQEVVIRDGDDDPPPKPVAKKPAQTPVPSPAAAAGSYMILVASYKERGNAEEQKAKLAMMGMQSRVEKVTIDNRDTFYRVRIGPERDLAAARSVVSELNANGIEGVVVKLK